MLMTNSSGNFVSSLIADLKERERLAKIIRGLDVPEGMGVALRAPSASRSEAEIASDFTQSLQLWEAVRDFTLRSNAPMLVYDPAAPPPEPRRR
jgi:ribonuclease E